MPITSSYFLAVFTQTRFGNPVILIGNYRFNKSSNCKGPKVRWICTKVHKGCKSTVTTFDNAILKVNHDHNHWDRKCIDWKLRLCSVLYALLAQGYFMASVVDRVASEAPHWQHEMDFNILCMVCHRFTPHGADASDCRKHEKVSEKWYSI